MKDHLSHRLFGERALGCLPLIHNAATFWPLDPTLQTILKGDGEGNEIMDDKNIKKIPINQLRQ